MRFRSWRYFWDYSGGNMTDQGTHLMDVVQWFTNSPQASSAISYGQKAKNTGSEVPDVFCAVFEYPKFMATWTLNYYQLLRQRLVHSIPGRRRHAHHQQ